MNVRNDRLSVLSSEMPSPEASFNEKRSCSRTKVNWQLEYKGVSSTEELIHEGSKLVDYSQLGACFLAMSDVQPGMELTMHVTLPVRMARPLVFRGVVVRVKEDADVMRLFKEVAVRWQPSRKKARAPRPAQAPAPPSS